MHSSLCTAIVAYIYLRLPQFLDYNPHSNNTLIIIGTELAGAAGAHAPPLFTPHPEIYSITCAYLSFWGENSPKFPVVHLHYLEQFGTSAHSNRTLKNEKN